MKKIKLIALLMSAMTAWTMSAQSPIAVDWQMGQNNTAANNYSCRFVIKNVSKQALDSGWQFFFNQFSRSVVLPAGCPVDVEEISTTYYRLKPNANYKALAAGDSLVVDMVMGGALINKNYMPAGGHVVLGGDMAHPIAVNINRSPLDKPGQWRDHKIYPDGNYMYSYNEAINGFGVTGTRATTMTFSLPPKRSILRKALPRWAASSPSRPANSSSGVVTAVPRNCSPMSWRSAASIPPVTRAL